MSANAVTLDRPSASSGDRVEHADHHKLLAAAQPGPETSPADRQQARASDSLKLANEGTLPHCSIDHCEQPAPPAQPASPGAATPSETLTDSNTQVGGAPNAITDNNNKPVTFTDSNGQQVTIADTNGTLTDANGNQINGADGNSIKVTNNNGQVTLTDSSGNPVAFNDNSGNPIALLEQPQSNQGGAANGQGDTGANTGACTNGKGDSGANTGACNNGQGDSGANTGAGTNGQGDTGANTGAGSGGQGDPLQQAFQDFSTALQDLGQGNLQGFISEFEKGMQQIETEFNSLLGSLTGAQTQSPTSGSPLAPGGGTSGGAGATGGWDGGAGTPATPDTPATPGTSTAGGVNQQQLDALLNFSGDPGINPSMKQQLTSDLNSLPASVQQALLQQGTQINVVPESQVGGGAAGYYDPGSNQITIGDGSGMEGEALVHEVAHATDQGPKGSGITNSQGFQSAMNQDLANGLPADFNSYASMLVDSPNNNQYGFGAGDVYAEIAAGLMGQDQTGVPAAIAKDFPATTAYIAQQLGVPDQVV